MREYKEKECVYCKETKKIAAKGLCRACYGRWKRNGKLEKVKIRNKCTVSDCDSFVVSHGYCEKHRSQVRRHGEIKNLRPEDWGDRNKHPLYAYWSDTRRRETLNISEKWNTDFWSFIESVSPRPSKGHYIRAVDLDKELGPDNWQWIEGVHKANREIASRKKKAEHDKSRLRLAADEKHEIRSRYGNKCGICGTESENHGCPMTGDKGRKKLAIDHCHTTGEIRGLLCSGCNLGIGNLKDSTELLQNAINYLQKHKGG